MAPPEDEANLQRDLRAVERDRERLATEVRDLQNTLTAARRKNMEPWAMQAALGGSLPKFNADPAANETFASFLQDYKLACDSFGMTEEQSALALGRCLDGHARQVYKDLVAANGEIKKDYKALTEGLEEKFKALTEGTRYGSSAFYSRKQLPGESVVTFYSDLKKLAKQAYPDKDSPMPDSQFLERFIRGMPLYLRRHVVSKEPKTPDEALKEACKKQQQQDFLAEDEETPVAAVAVQDDLAKKLESLTVQVNNLNTQLTQTTQANPYSLQKEQGQQNQWSGKWPVPEHHFPYQGQNFRPTQNYRPRYNHSGHQQARARTNFQPRYRTPAPRQPARKPNFNREGEPLCFYCQRYGHYQSACREKRQQSTSRNTNRANTQVRQVDVVEEEATAEATHGSGLSAHNAYLYLALVCVILPFPTADAQRPMVCQTAAPGQLFTLPKPVPCNYTMPKAMEIPEYATYKLYKHNLMEYEVEGWLCRGSKQTAKLLTYFFGDEHLQEFNTYEEEVTTDMCRSMVKTKLSPAGMMSMKSTGVYATDNSLDWKTPSWGVPDCCRWHYYEATNFFLIPVKVYKRHDVLGFQSSGADVSNCRSYFSGQCQVGKQALIWKPEDKAKCRYVFYKTMVGRLLMSAWLASDKTLALTHAGGRTEVDCGTKYNISDQQIPFIEISRKTQYRVKRDAPNQAKLRERRGAGIEEDYIVLADELSAQLETVYINMRIEISQSFVHAMRTVCEDMHATARLLRAMALSLPTQTARTLLNDDMLYARSGYGILEVWKCLPVNEKHFAVLKQQDGCTEEIPVNFTFYNKTQTGYLNPVTLIISHQGQPTDCSLVSTTPLQVFGSVYTYSREAGMLVKTASSGDLKVLSYAWNNQHSQLLAPEIVTPVLMYSWEEMQPTDDLNALLHTTAAQAEVLSLLGAQFQTEEDSDSDTVAAELSNGIVARGLMSMALLLRNPFHVWVFLTCLLLTLHVATKYIIKKYLWPRLTRRIKQIRKRCNPRKRTPPEEVRFTVPNASDDAEGDEEPVEVLAERYAATTGVNLICSIKGDDSSIILMATVNGKLGRFLFDSGSAISLISESKAKELGATVQPATCPIAVSVTGERIDLRGEINALLKIADKEIDQTFRVLRNCSHDGIIGYDCIQKWGPLMLDIKARKMRIGDSSVPLEHSRTPPLKLCALEQTKIPARCMSVVYCKTHIPITPGQQLVFEQNPNKYHQFMSPNTLVAASDSIPIRVVNSARHPITIYRGQSMGTVEAAKVCAVTSGQKQRKTNKDVFEHLDLDSSVLTWKQQEELTELLKRYKHLFATSETQLPGTTVVKHAIAVTDSRPIKQKAYRVPTSMRKALDEKLDELLEGGIISPSCSPYASPLVIVKKPDGSIRPCVDFRKLNSVTVADSHPLPRVDESIEFLSGSKYLTTLDLYAGFMQVPMEEDSKKYTAFITSRGLFEFNFLPFGLRNAPATFSRMMQFVLSGLLFDSSMLYMDDILVCSKTWENHLDHLERVFKRLDHYDLRLKMKKCCFARRKLPFLGHLVTTDGIMPDPDNVRKIIAYDAPTTVTQTRSFLGFVNYYRRFIPGYADIARPLHNLTRKDTKFAWTNECQQSFEALKARVTRSPILVYPCFDRPFLVSADASNSGCGAVLSQVVEGRDQPIAYFSRRFNPAERRYETVEQELYAVVSALKHWKHFLYGHQVFVYSDQKSLSWGIKQCDSPRMMRWIQQMAEFDVKIFYRPGKKNGPADFLSRMDPAPNSELLYDNSESTLKVSAIYGLQYGSKAGEYFKTEQLKDADLAKVIEYKEDPSRPADRETKDKAKRFKFTTRDRCLVNHSTEGVQQFVVPSHLKGRILEELHDSTWGAHLGIARTYDKIAQRFYWDGMRKDVENWVNSCSSCLSRKLSTRPTKQDMTPISANAPWQTVVIDLVGPLPKSSRGHQWVLVMMDRFTKYPECVALRSATATAVARAFLTNIVTRHGVPLEIASDRGAQFTSAMFGELSRMLGMKQRLSCAYRPETQGLVERWNRTMAEMLRHFVATNQKDWCQYLDLVMLAYRTSVHSSTGHTPFELEHGRQARLPTHLLIPEDSEQFSSEHEFVSNLHGKLRAAYDSAREVNEAASLSQKQYHDRNVNPSDLKVGEKVYLLRPSPQAGLTPKLQPKYKGPFLLTLILGKDGLIGPVPPNRGKPTWVHLNHLRRATPRAIQEFDWNNPAEDEPQTDGDAGVVTPHRDSANEAGGNGTGETTDSEEADEVPSSENVSGDGPEDEQAPAHRYSLRKRRC